MLSEHNNLQVVASLGTRDGFMVDEASPVLNEESKKTFHTSVAKLLYLSRQARLDIISAVGFFCTRVKMSAEEDLRKLRKVLGYLKGANDWMMKM
jgi:hypothetical protein